jgi:hypothetical protein
MPIVLDFGCSVQDYVAHFARLVFPRLDSCPCCGQPGCLIGHGYYERQALDQAEVFRLKIKRWLCKACRQTTAVLPSFLLRFRHYVLAVIDQALTARFELAASWQAVCQLVAQDGLPALRTLVRWCRSFAVHAPRWWAAVLAVLAETDATSPALDPLGPSVGPQDAPRGLLHSALHLLAWAKTRWPQLADYGLKDRLPYLWHWGQGRGLGRLV